MSKVIGVCAIALLALSAVVEASPREAVKPGGRTEVLFFKADWAAPCRQMQPIVDRLVSEGVPIRVIDYEAMADVARHHRVDALPTLIFLKAGREYSRLVGAVSEFDVRDHLREVGFELGESDQSLRLREHLSNWPTPQQMTKRVQFPPIAMNRDDQSIYDELDELTHVTFEGMPLSDGLWELSQRHGITIVIDHDSIDEAGLDVDATVDVVLDGVTLRAMLKLLLEAI